MGRRGGRDELVDPPVASLTHIFIFAVRVILRDVLECHGYALGEEGRSEVAGRASA